MTGWAGFWLMIGMISTAEIIMEYIRRFKWGE